MEYSNKAEKWEPSYKGPDLQENATFNCIKDFKADF